MIDKIDLGASFMPVDYAYGRNVQCDTTAMIEAAGGRVAGSTPHSPDTKDVFSSLALGRQLMEPDRVAAFNAAWRRLAAGGGLPQGRRGPSR